MRILLISLLVSATASAACSTDSRGIVITGLSAQQDNLLGPLVCSGTGTNPWTFWDLAEGPTATNIATNAISEAPTLGTACTGTVSWTQGNQYATTSADMTGCLSGYSYVVFAWNTVDGNGTGRSICPISSVTTSQINCSTQVSAPTSSGITAYQLSFVPDAFGCTPGCWTATSPSVSWNYYDVALALYRIYYRTGTTSYLTQARQMADIQWQWVIDHGYNYVYPRAASMISQFYRALDGNSGRFPGLQNWVNTVSAFSLIGASAAASPNIDNRESGYSLWDNALGAETDPDSTRHAAYCSALTTYVPTWNSAQAADGSFPENEYYLNPSYASAPKSYSGTFQYQGAPWREAINVKALEAAYESLNDTSSAGCNNTSLAATTLTTITNAVTWQHNYGRSSVNRGIFYEVNSQSNDQMTVYPGTGTVSVSTTSNPTTLTGSGTNWNTAGYCDGTHFTGIQSSPVRGVYKIASCSGDGTATISPAFGSFGETAGSYSGLTWAPAPAASTSCGSSSATYCYTGAASADLNLPRTVCGGEGWLYAQTGNSTYLAWADDCASIVLGGPTAGLTSAISSLPGTFTPCSGPACTGYVNDMVTGAPSCNDTGGTPPCLYGGSLASNLGKNFGEVAGAPGIDNELAWRLWYTGAGDSVSSGKVTVTGNASIN